MAKFTEIMLTKRFYIGAFVLVVGLASLTEGTAPPKSKRQIYREQVLPSKGGKIPDAAFTSDRLALNRLNKEGISIPDGVLLEHRHVHHHPHIQQHDPEDEDSLIKIIQRPEDRYVASAGKYDNKGPFTVSSTYLIRKPIGPEGTGLRSPLEHSPYHETLSQNHGNQIYQYYPDNQYQQQYSQNYVPAQLPQKYLPGQLTAPPQKYVEIASPQKYLPSELSAPPPADLTGPPANVIHHPPYGFSPAPVSYQQVHQSVAYYPIHVPLVLPNKEITKGDFYTLKGQGNSYGSHRDVEDIHSVVDWPYLLKQYTRLSNKINVLDHDAYVQSTPHSLFLTPEVSRVCAGAAHDVGINATRVCHSEVTPWVLGSVDSSYYATRERYARKSKEIAFTDGGPETSPKARLKDRRRLIKLKCTSGLENTVEDGSSKCFIRY